MTILEIFEKVNLSVPMEQRVFFNYFEDTVNELQALYRDFVFVEGTEDVQTQEMSERAVDANENVYINGNIAEEQKCDDVVVEMSAKEYTPPKSLTDENVVLPLYHNSIVDNILFLAGKGEFYKGEFLRKSNDAYLKYWNDNAKGRRIRRMRW